MLGLGQGITNIKIIPFVNKYSMLFDGTNDYIDYGDVATYDALAVLSISAWFKSSNSGSDQGIVSKGNPDRDNDGYVIFYDSEEIYFDIETDAGNFRVNTTGNAFAADGTWYHLAVIYNGSTVKIYKDASVVKTGTSITGTTVGTSASLLIGKMVTASGDPKYFTGNIDEVAIWNVELSAADITAIYNSGNPTDLTTSVSYDTDRTGNLKGYWRFEEGSGTSATDSSDEGNNGTITNGAAYNTSVPG